MKPDECKAWLWEKIEKVKIKILLNNSQKLDELEDIDRDLTLSKTYKPRVVDVCFGYTDYGNFGDLKEIRGLEKAMIE